MEKSSGLAVIMLQQPAEAFLAENFSRAWPFLPRGAWHNIFQTLMGPFLVIMFQEIFHQIMEMVLPEDDEVIQGPPKQDGEPWTIEVSWAGLNRANRGNVGLG